MADDHKIAKLLNQQAEEGLDLAHKEYARMLYLTAYRLLGNHEDAEEIVNDTLLVLWKTGKEGGIHEKSIRSFAKQIAHNLALKKLSYLTAEKRRNNSVSLEELASALPGRETPESRMAASELGEKLNQFLGGLSKENRILFVRRFWFGDSYESLAEISGKTESSLRTKMARLLGKLKNELKKEGYV